MNHTEIFDRLWKMYAEQNPSVQKIFDLFTNEGEDVKNDHIAFRTFNDPRVGIDVLAKPILKAGYVHKGDYDFAEKKLNAKHYEHATDADAPRIFISELRLEEFSQDLQKTAKAAIGNIPLDILASDELIFSGQVFGKPSFTTYQSLREESEYAAWLYVYGFCANHFTVSINSLKTMPEICLVNKFLKQNGFHINDSGGEVKGSSEELLEQSSIKAEIIAVDFVEGPHPIPGCYYEFAKRYVDTDGKLYSGFIAKSADKIFESTDFYEK
ncbi:MAG: DUF1338 domain-containing protein [Bacteroidales bacterium]|nr:DUF1338 domain-containing protein [Bacteroidales bacterium]MCF8458233.1 DUF1338 domain-containing protein [Bacteroidales bacterium]